VHAAPRCDHIVQYKVNARAALAQGVHNTTVFVAIGALSVVVMFVYLFYEKIGHQRARDDHVHEFHSQTDDFSDCGIMQLRKLLRARYMSIRGAKSVLLSRLLRHQRSVLYTVSFAVPLQPHPTIETTTAYLSTSPPQPKPAKNSQR